MPLSTKIDNKKYFLFFDEVDLNKLVIGSDSIQVLIKVVDESKQFNRLYIITDSKAEIVTKGKFVY